MIIIIIMPNHCYVLKKSEYILPVALYIYIYILYIYIDIYLLNNEILGDIRCSAITTVCCVGKAIFL